MDISLDDEELEVICEGLQQLEETLDDGDEEKLKKVRQVFQRLQTLRTAK